MHMLVLMPQSAAAVKLAQVWQKPNAQAAMHANMQTDPHMLPYHSRENEAEGARQLIVITYTKKNYA